MQHKQAVITSKLPDSLTQRIEQITMMSRITQRATPAVQVCIRLSSELAGIKGS